MDTPGGVNAQFNMKYLERGAEELRDRWRVETGRNRLIEFKITTPDRCCEGTSVWGRNMK